MNDSVQIAQAWPVGPAGDSTSAPSSPVMVKHFRQILMWLLRVIPFQARGTRIPKYWEPLEALGQDCPWREVEDEFGDPGNFQERHYQEFNTFLPNVQHFLYGEGLGREGQPDCGKSGVRVFRRRDIAQLRVVLKQGMSPLLFQIAHVDLYFLHDIDIVIPVVEFFANDLPLSLAEDVLFRVGRAYPGFWEPGGRGAQ